MKPNDLAFAQFLLAENIITQKEIDVFKSSRSLSFKLYLLAGGILTIDKYQEIVTRFEKLEQVSRKNIPEQNLVLVHNKEDESLSQNLQSEQSKENLDEPLSQNLQSEQSRENLDEPLPQIDLNNLSLEKEDGPIVSIPMKKIKVQSKQEKRYQISPPNKAFTNSNSPILPNNNFPEISFNKKEKLDEDNEKDSQEGISSIYEKKKLYTLQMHISQNFPLHILN